MAYAQMITGMLAKTRAKLPFRYHWYYPLIFVVAATALAFAIAPGTPSASPVAPAPVSMAATDPAATTTAPAPTTTSTTTSTTTLTRARRVTAPVLPPHPAASAPAAVAATTSTTTPPLSPLEIAQREVGRTGPYADGGYWCAQFASWVAEQAQVPGFTGDSSPSHLRAKMGAAGQASATPVVGGLIFIDLLGQGSNQYVTHVGIVETVEGDTIHTIEGNALPNRDVVTRHVRHLGDTYVVDFASFDGDEL